MKQKIIAVYQPMEFDPEANEWNKEKGLIAIVFDDVWDVEHHSYDKRLLGITTIYINDEEE